MKMFTCHQEGAISFELRTTDSKRKLPKGK